MSSFFLYSGIIALLALCVPEKVRLQIGRNEHKISIFLVLALGLMCFMAGFRRYDIGNDTLAYQRFFTHMRAGDYLYDARIESIFRYLAIAISKFTDNYTYFLLITSVLIFLYLGKYIEKYCENQKLYITLFWFFAYIAFVSPLRQSLALVVVFLSLGFVEKKKYLFFVICIFLASLCHSSAFIALIFPFLYYTKPKSGKVFIALLLVIVLVGSGAISFFANSLLGDYYSRYLNVESGFLAAAFNAIFGIMPILIDKYKNSADEDVPHYYNLIRWSSAVYAGFYITSVYSSGAGRIAYYFLPMTISYWCYVIDRKSWKPWTRRLIILTLFTVLIVYRVLVMIYRPEWNSFFPFHYVWESY